MTTGELLTIWRAQAAQYERDGVTVGARVLARCASELEAALHAAESEALTLEAAARESGYSPDHLRHLVANGTIPNAGRRRAPRIARRDLPKRAARPNAATDYDPNADALRLVSGERGA